MYESNERRTAAVGVGPAGLARPAVELLAVAGLAPALAEVAAAPHPLASIVHGPEGAQGKRRMGEPRVVADAHTAVVHSLG